ncbi:hypothetical protein F4693_000152 [Sphingomonas endophytica]|uniref:Sulfate transporter n=1 Tax=Sphingomonas endophytica TaxID=869719 RepID=A0A7X0J8V6_9SPHN|nr:DUF3164 family protein [Sphingomonas endophytica]MBB6503203.1 hypothetical protein [Sphingomonas endophytica]
MTAQRAHPAAVDVGGQPYLRDAKGALVPLSTVKATDLLMDEVVRKVIDAAAPLSAQLRQFKEAAFTSVGEFQALLAQEYNAAIGGKKGNITLTSYDGCRKVQVQVSDILEFGPELQAAKALIDECLAEWAAGSGAELRALVNRVFSVDKEGRINRAELFMLLRVEIADERWKRAMNAIRESIRIIGSRSYVRFYERDGADAAWRAIPLDIAAV